MPRPSGSSSVCRYDHADLIREPRLDLDLSKMAYLSSWVVQMNPERERPECFRDFETLSESGQIPLSVSLPLSRVARQMPVARRDGVPQKACNVQMFPEGLTSSSFRVTQIRIASGYAPLISINDCCWKGSIEDSQNGLSGL